MHTMIPCMDIWCYMMWVYMHNTCYECTHETRVMCLVSGHVTVCVHMLYMVYMMVHMMVYTPAHTLVYTPLKGGVYIPCTRDTPCIMYTMIQSAYQDTRCG
jgi:hypothetical protein